MQIGVVVAEDADADVVARQHFRRISSRVKFTTQTLTPRMRDQSSRHHRHRLTLRK
jgi:hypothetical protein